MGSPCDRHEATTCAGFAALGENDAEFATICWE